MLNWSWAKYKLTLGVGGLAIAGMLSELWQKVLPAWLAVATAILPFVIFLLVVPGELPARIVRIAHVAASVWYVVAAVGLLVAFAAAGPLPRGWPVYAAGAAIGAVPCCIVLYRASLGRYRSPEEASADESTLG